MVQEAHTQGSLEATSLATKFRLSDVKQTQYTCVHSHKFVWDIHMESSASLQLQAPNHADNYPLAQPNSSDQQVTGSQTQISKLYNMAIIICCG